MSYCPGCGRADMAGITHVCPPPDGNQALEHVEIAS